MKAQKHKPDTRSLAYSYLRFSSPEQAKGDSLRRQTGMRDEWCTRHGVTLDTSLNMTDAGVSAFTGDHRSNPDRHALAGFLELVRVGKVARGSYFIIENLDRLTREDSVPAVNLFTGILLSGIRIVQLDPETIYTDRSDSMDVMRAVLEMSRGHSESMNKSRRMSAVWGEKRKKATAEKTVISRSCPAWIRVEGIGTSARYTIHPKRAEVVQRIFRMATDGYGTRLIVKALTGEKVPPFGRKPWNTSYLKLMLKSRTTFGEFTPRTGRGSSAKRKPDGQPIANYYPAAITEDVWFAAQEAMKKRTQQAGDGEQKRGVGGRPSKEIVNVFSAMLQDARTGERLHLRQYAERAGKDRKVLRHYIAPYAGTEHRAANISFPLAVFEAAVFSSLAEINPNDLLPDAEGEPNVLLALAGRLSEIDGKLARIKERIRTGDELDMLIDLVRELEGERKRVGEQLTVARQVAACPVSDAWGECQSIIQLLATAPDKDAARVKLRAAIRRTIESVWCLFLPGRGPRLAAAQIWFAGGQKHRDYAILYRPRHAADQHHVREAEWAVRSLVEMAPGKFDLRNKDEAAAAEKVLAALDPAVLLMPAPTADPNKKPLPLPKPKRKGGAQ